MSQKDRITFLNNTEILEHNSYLVYWCSQSYRGSQNHSLEYAIYLANKYEVALVVCTCMDTKSESSIRHIDFELKAQQALANSLKKKNIACIHVCGKITVALHYLSLDAIALILDKGYSKEYTIILNELKNNISCALHMVESNVVVPVESASIKQEFAAYTIRPKIKKLMNNYLVKINEQNTIINSYEFMRKQNRFTALLQDTPYLYEYKGETYPLISYSSDSISSVDFIKTHFSQADKSVIDIQNEVNETRVINELEHFISHYFISYDELARDPCTNDCMGTCSKMSHYLRLGIISPIQIVLMLDEFVEQFSSTQEEDLQKIYNSYERYTDELIIRRELAYNYCYFNPYYDSFSGLPNWAKITLEEHLDDPRDYIYDLQDLEQAQTYDKYWNAAQAQLVKSGHMHGYMRMYWGKKILEWSLHPEEAYNHAIYLNNKYALDAPDPNSFAGVSWCFGEHDRPFTQRSIFGKVRYMNANGLRRKFKKIDEYCETWLET